ncbi:MAG: CCC motif membrane protein [Bacteroidales bacterium]|nr:CCC motif membrane protein [Bacteroidales bacterium]
METENNDKNKTNVPNEQNNKRPDIPEISQIPPIPGQEEYQQESIDRGFAGNINPNGNNQETTAQQNQQQANQQQTNQQANQQNYTQQPPNTYQQTNNPYPNTFKIKIPNSGGILTLGILSILSLCCCGPFLGPILAIIALALIPKAKRSYNENPTLYKTSSIGNLKAGQICAIIGLSLGILLALFTIYMYIGNPEDMNEINQAINEAWNETGY